MDGELKFALMVLQKAAEYNGLLQNLQAKLPDEESDACRKLETEYFTLRIVLVSRILLFTPRSAADNPRRPGKKTALT